MNFITQIAAKKLDLPTTEDRAPSVTTLDGHDLLTFGMHRSQLRVKDTNGKQRVCTEELVAADMAGYDVILGMSWLEEHEPDILWKSKTWTWRPPRVQLLSATALMSLLQRQRKTNRKAEAFITQIGEAPRVTVLTWFHITCISLFVFITSRHVSYKLVCLFHITNHHVLPFVSICFHIT